MTVFYRFASLTKGLRKRRSRMSLTLVCASVALNFDLLGVVEEYETTSCHGVVFVAAILFLLTFWSAGNLVKKVYDRQCDRKELIRRRRLGLSTQFEKRAESSAKSLRSNVCVLCSVLTCLLILSVSEFRVGDGFSSIVHFDSSNVSKLANYRCMDSENINIDKSYAEFMLTVKEELAKQAETLKKIDDKNELVYEMVVQDRDESADVALVSNGVVREENAETVESGAIDEDGTIGDSDADQEEKKEVEFESRKGTIAFIPNVSGTSVKNEAVSQNVVRQTEKNDLGRSAYSSSNEVVSAPAVVPTATNLRESSPLNANELRVLDPVQASLLEESYFNGKIVAGSKISLEDEFMPVVGSKFTAVNRNRISLAGAETLKSPAEAEVSLIDSAVSSDSSLSEGNESKSILEMMDEEANRISVSVRSCVLPIVAVKASSTPQRVNEETGCAFLTTYQGKTLAITNYHVIRETNSNESIKVFLPNKQVVNPVNVRVSADFDIAVLELDPSKLPSDGSLTYCKFGDSDTLQVANAIFTFGSPFGLDKSVTFGHVSALRRSNKDLNASSQENLPEYIQIDAAINPGNSGGPMYNARGEVVGVVTAIATTTGKNEGVAFAIPSNILMRVVKTLMDKGEWRRSRLGIELARTTRADLASTNFVSVFGAKIKEIQSRSPAANAGLRSGDVVLAFNGTPVEDDLHLARMIALADPAEKARLSVLRGEQFFELEASLIPSRVQSAVR